jgi:hypothetical protein
MYNAPRAATVVRGLTLIRVGMVSIRHLCVWSDRKGADQDLGDGPAHVQKHIDGDDHEETTVCKLCTLQLLGLSWSVLVAKSSAHTKSSFVA